MLQTHTFQWSSLSGIQRRVVLLKYSDVSEVRTASIIRVMTEAVRTSETSAYLNETARRYILEGCFIQNLKYQIYFSRWTNLQQFQVAGRCSSYKVVCVHKDFELHQTFKTCYVGAQEFLHHLLTVCPLSNENLKQWFSNWVPRNIDETWIFCTSL
jgi:phosphoribosylformylglycinamidine (FGAM) synthase PurS component